MSVEPTPPASAEDPVFSMHRGGKISVRPTVDVTDSDGLAMAYTPGVARVCSAIAERPELAADYTCVAGACASGGAVTKMLLRPGIGDVAVSDSKGLIYHGRDGLNPVKAALAAQTNKAGLTGSTESALHGADVFIGLSSGKVPEQA